MSNNKETKDEDNIKGTGKAPAYKLQYDIEFSVDLKGILEDKNLDA